VGFLPEGGGATNIEDGIVETISKTQDLDKKPGFMGEAQTVGRSADLKPQVDEIHIEEGWGMLQGSKMNKAFCSCGAIAELDSSTIRLKKKLGKEVECRHCRNRRIAEELEELKVLYSQGDEGWLL